MAGVDYERFEKQKSQVTRKEVPILPEARSQVGPSARQFILNYSYDSNCTS